MKLNFIYTLFILLVGGFFLSGFSFGRAAATGEGSTGAPGETTTCQTCHSTGTDIIVDLGIELTDENGTVVSTYTPEATYTVKVTLTSTGNTTPAGYGFQLTSLLDADDSEVNTWASPSSNAKISVASVLNRTYVEQAGTSASNEFTVQWTAPASGSGDVSFYSCGNGVDGANGSVGDGASNPVQLTLSEADPSGINDILASQVNMGVSPNPVQDMITIKTNSQIADDFNLRIISLTGQAIQQENIHLANGENTHTVDMDALPQGIYFVQLQNNIGVISRKVVKL